ncbi:hypothetical protein [Spongiactinospora sp. TRM90649]|uniref:hypothetical protein n=1 Tax=Spongiactinospora sp. TRM90649 TaxID=3031114 RepID=UPI0023F8FB71|nr:hypothetical protein [Spongiactinospora sp. TRM90649]MDF5753698.1 hypothetical protein [Spongiactinospora sp. TRM90649]
MDLDEAAERLYGLDPERFVAERDALSREARASGDAALARSIGGLRRPTVAAWAVNRAARAHPGEFAELFELGARLRAAWADHDPDEIVDLTRARGPLTTRLARLVRESAREAGRPLAGGAAAEVEQTLDAATVDEQAAEQVRRGRLNRSLSYTGFTPAPAPAAERPRPRRKRAEPTPAPPPPDDRRAELEQALAEAERAADQAARDHAEWAGELEQSTEEYERMSARVESLTRQLAEAEQNLAATAHRRDVAARDESRSRHTARSTRHKAEQAAQALADHHP